MKERICRYCNNSLHNTFVDLGLSPVSNAFVRKDMANNGSRFYPLHTYVCDECYLVQLEEFEAPEEIFNQDYAYFSSFSDSWLKHAKDYVQLMIDKYSINQSSNVIEIACNDGYLLQYFNEQMIPVLGIEPATNVAKVARDKGIPVETSFFGTELALDLVGKGQQADLLIGNNVLAHVPNINDFVKGMKKILNKEGIITLEFPHLLRLIQENQFDTIYHEHFSYLSLITVKKIFERFGLTIFHVEELPTHGKSLRIYVKHTEDQTKLIENSVLEVELLEIEFGLNNIETYKSFSEKVKMTKRRILELLIHLKIKGKTIVGYGAPAKGNTLLNYCGIGKDFIDYVVDRNPIKQNTLLPGTLIPVFSPDEIRRTKPDILVIMPWNIKEEIIEQMSYIKEWDGQFVVLIPEPQVLM